MSSDQVLESFKDIRLQMTDQRGAMLELFLYIMKVDLSKLGRSISRAKRANSVVNGTIDAEDFVGIRGRRSTSGYPRTVAREGSICV
jgi:hypothetical protein